MYSEKEKRRTSGGHNLAFKMWSTKGARFVADERCKRTATLSTFTIAFLSFEVIAISIYSLTGNLNNYIDSNTITAWTLILSILFLVLSIFENAKNYSLKAKNYHNCGLDIGKVYSKLKQILAKHKNEDYNEQNIIENLSKQYEDILDKYENHEQIDYLQFQVNKSKDFKIGNWQKSKNSINIYKNSSLLYHILILIGPILFALYISNNTFEKKSPEKTENSTEQNSIKSDTIKTTPNTVYKKLLN